MDTYNVNSNILLALELLNARGYEAYIVGGAVRDMILDMPIDDYDIATSATLKEAEDVFKDYKTKKYAGKGITMGVVINHTHFELSTYKGATILEDLANRDFSMNSIAYHPKTSIYDPYNGIYDMSKKNLKTVKNPDIVFKEDPIRILRAIRFYATRGMKPDSITKESMIRNKELLRGIKPERIAHELDPVLVSEIPSVYFREYIDVYSVIIPKLKACQGFDQKNRKWHTLDVLEHIFKVLDSTKNNLVLRMAALFHDITKPDAFTLDEKGIGHFYGHDQASSDYAREILIQLKYGHVFIDRVCNIIFYHDFDIENTDKSCLQFLYRFGTQDLDLFFGIKRADIMGQNPALYDRIYEVDEITARIKRLIDEEKIITYRNLRINGNDLMELGYHGEEIGRTLAHILDLVIHHQLKNDPEKLYSYAAKYKYHMHDNEGEY